ncbi:DUF5625 family protein [Herbaspirillum rhizosphaerae]|uniref:DUF5625 family protein n=1 Tax=Herbaspirillum rhizosphaerae TaxID=346179 RepID=UPI000A7CC194|nr:DUF5625 family protein [Herbaspirillum rhizosphaerae]
MSNSKNRFSIFQCILIGLLVASAISVSTYMHCRSPEPSSVQIKLTESGVVADFKFEVRKHFPYWYSMRFGFPKNDQVERERVRKILGGNTMDKTGKPLESGTPTPINLIIFAICTEEKEVEVYSQDADPILTSWGQSHFEKNIGSHVLSPGMYRARLINKRASPEFSSIPTSFEIAMPAKVNFNPQKEPTRNEPCQQ